MKGICPALALAVAFVLFSAQPVLPQCVDEDGDGYESAACGGPDCLDDPSGDPPQCATCLCGVGLCSFCAACVHPGAEDVCGDGVDTDCEPYDCECFDSDEDGFDDCTDCRDDPSFDPSFCVNCECGTAECAICAKCVNPEATEFPDDGMDSNCNGQADHFLAHAAFGTPSESKLSLMRNFRDEVLLPTAWGTRFTIFYYKWSPPLARFIEQYEPLRAVCRLVLQPVFGILWVLLHL